MVSLKLKDQLQFQDHSFVHFIPTSSAPLLLLSIVLVQVQLIRLISILWHSFIKYLKSKFVTLKCPQFNYYGATHSETHSQRLFVLLEITHNFLIDHEDMPPEKGPFSSSTQPIISNWPRGDDDNDLSQHHAWLSLSTSSSSSRLRLAASQRRNCIMEHNG